jgi:hypothetical protein
LAGQAHDPALQASPPAAQSVPACQVKQAEPLVTGRQTCTWSPVGPHRVASATAQAFVDGHVQAAPPPPSTQAAPGSLHAAAEASYQHPPAGAASWAQVTTCPVALQKLAVVPPQRVGAHWQEAADPDTAHSW